MALQTIIRRRLSALPARGALLATPQPPRLSRLRGYHFTRLRPGGLSHDPRGIDGRHPRRLSRWTHRPQGGSLPRSLPRHRTRLAARPNRLAGFALAGRPWLRTVCALPAAHRTNLRAAMQFGIVRCFPREKILTHEPDPILFEPPPLDHRCFHYGVRPDRWH